MQMDSIHKKLFEVAISGVQSVTDQWELPGAGAAQKSKTNRHKRRLRHNSPGNLNREIQTQLSLFNEQ